MKRGSFLEPWREGPHNLQGEAWQLMSQGCIQEGGERDTRKAFGTFWEKRVRNSILRTLGLNLYWIYFPYKMSEFIMFVISTLFLLLKGNLLNLRGGWKTETYMDLSSFLNLWSIWNLFFGRSEKTDFTTAPVHSYHAQYWIIKVSPQKPLRYVVMFYFMIFWVLFFHMSYIPSYLPKFSQNFPLVF